MKRRFRAAGILDSDDDPRGLDIGFLKTDRLVDGSLSREALLRRYGLAGDRPVILFAPTGQRGNSLETMGEELLGRLARDGRYDLLIKLHDHPADSSIDWAARIRSMRLGERVGIVTDLDVILPLALSDLLISDASSVSSEYALTGRPIVFLDVPELLASARAAIESQLDLETWGRRGGVVVRSPDEVVPAIAHCLAHPEQRRDVRLKMARDLFFNPGKATEAALAWVQTKLGLA